MKELDAVVAYLEKAGKAEMAGAVRAAKTDLLNLRKNNRRRNALDRSQACVLKTDLRMYILQMLPTTYTTIVEELKGYHKPESITLMIEKLISKKLICSEAQFTATAEGASIYHDHFINLGRLQREADAAFFSAGNSAAPSKQFRKGQGSNPRKGRIF